jgi:hypothetical protein
MSGTSSGTTMGTTDSSRAPRSDRN